MASFIPFDHSSFVLGHIVEPELFKLLNEMKSVQVETDIALDKMNSIIALKRGLGMTLNELLGLRVDVGALKTKLVEVDAQLSDSATEYLDTRIKNDSILQGLRVQMAKIQPMESPESPLNFDLTKLVSRLIASDSIRMNAQYFSYGSDEASSNKTLSAIQETIKDHNDELQDQSRAIAKNAVAQIESQRRNRSLAGTLIIMATCTHRNAAILEPVVYDADKLVAAWNHVHGRSEHALDLATASPTRLQATLASALKGRDAADGPTINLLTGMSTGSSFVGMIHTINDDVGEEDLNTEEVEKLQKKLELGAWLQNSTGGFGVDSEILKAVRSKINARNVSCSANVIVTGALVSLSSGNFEMGVDKILLEGRGMPSADDQDQAQDQDAGIFFGAAKARRGQRERDSDNQRRAAILENLQNADSQTHQVIDVNSLMSAFENYVRNVREKNFVGVPLNFFTRRISKDEVVRTFCDDRGLLQKKKKQDVGPPADSTGS